LYDALFVKRGYRRLMRGFNISEALRKEYPYDFFLICYILFHPLSTSAHAFPYDLSSAEVTGSWVPEHGNALVLSAAFVLSARFGLLFKFRSNHVGNLVDVDRLLGQVSRYFLAHPQQSWWSPNLSDLQKYQKTFRARFGKEGESPKFLSSIKVVTEENITFTQNPAPASPRSKGLMFMSGRMGYNKSGWNNFSFELGEKDGIVVKNNEDETPSILREGLSYAESFYGEPHMIALSTKDPGPHLLSDLKTKSLLCIFFCGLR